MVSTVNDAADHRRRSALDAMGGDHARLAPVAGAVRAARAWGYEIELVGRESEVRAAVRQQGDLTGVEHLLQIVHAPEVIEMSEHPVSAVRSKRHSSMATGIELVKSGGADAFVSAGNTGGVLATALLGLRRIEGITSERPALAAQVPTLKGPCVLLDIGANVDVKPEWLAQFALMGSIYAEVALGRKRPSVATLSNGEEEGKGNAVLSEALPLLRALPIHYVGNVEGSDVTAGAVDPVGVAAGCGRVRRGAERFARRAAHPAAPATDRLARAAAACTPGRDRAANGAEHLTSSALASGISVLPVSGIGEIAPGADLAAALQT